MTRTRWKSALPALLALALVVAACGDDDATTTTAGTAATTTTVAATTTTAAATTTTEAPNPYEGETLEMLIGFSAGGGNDLVSRIVAQYLGQELGANIVPVNEPGAGGLAAANSAFTAGASDGSVVVNTSQSLVLAQALEDETVLYDHAALHWLGSVSSLPVVCVTRTGAGYTSIDELIDGPAVPVGATAPGSIPFDSAVAINGALGTNFNVITGYEGSSEILLAIERGELDGLCIALIPAILEWIQTGFAVPLVVMGEVPAGQDDWEAALEGVPRAGDLAEGAQAQELLTAVQGPNDMVYAYAVHPDTPADRVAALQAGFEAMLANPDFATALEELGRIFAPKNAAEVQTLVESILSLSPETAQLLKDLREGN